MDGNILEVVIFLCSSCFSSSPMGSAYSMHVSQHEYVECMLSACQSACTVHAWYGVRPSLIHLNVHLNEWLYAHSDLNRTCISQCKNIFLQDAGLQLFAHFLSLFLLMCMSDSVYASVQMHVWPMQCIAMRCPCVYYACKVSTMYVCVHVSVCKCVCTHAHAYTTYRYVYVCKQSCEHTSTTCKCIWAAILISKPVFSLPALQVSWQQAL